MSVPALSGDLGTQISQWDQWELVDALLAKPEFVLLETVQISVITTRVSVHIPDRREAKPLNGKLPLLERLRKLDVSYIGPRKSLTNCHLSLAGYVDVYTYEDDS